MADLKKNFMYQSIWQVFVLLLPLVTSPYLARVIGAEGLGVYSLTYSVITYFALVANLGIEKYGNREIAKNRNNRVVRSQIFSEIYFFHVILSLIVIFVYFVYVAIVAKYKTYAAIQSLYLLGTLLSFTWLFAGMEDFKKIVIRDSIIKIFVVICIFILVKDTDDLWLYILIMAFATLASSIVLWFHVSSYVDFKKVQWRCIVKHIVPMIVLFVPVALENIYAYMDRIMLGYQSGIDQVGFYDNSTKVLISKSIIFSLGTVMMPRMTALIEEKKDDKINDYLVKSTEIVILLSAAFSFGTAAVAFEFPTIFWGSDFASCSWIIFVMAFSLPFQCISNEIRTHYLIPASRNKQYMISAIVGTVFNFASNFLLIPLLGAMGAAVTTLCSEVIVLIFQLMLCHKEFSFVKYIFNNKIYFFIGFIMFIFVRIIGYLLGVHIYTLIIETLFGAIIYVLCCVVYWKVTHKYYLLNMLLIYVKRKK